MLWLEVTQRDQQKPVKERYQMRQNSVCNWEPMGCASEHVDDLCRSRGVRCSVELRVLSRGFDGSHISFQTYYLAFGWVVLLYLRSFEYVLIFVGTMQTFKNLFCHISCHVRNRRMHTSMLHARLTVWLRVWNTGGLWVSVSHVELVSGGAASFGGFRVPSFRIESIV